MPLNPWILRGNPRLSLRGAAGDVAISVGHQPMSLRGTGVPWQSRWGFGRLLRFVRTEVSLLNLNSRIKDATGINRNYLHHETQRAW